MIHQLRVSYSYSATHLESRADDGFEGTRAAQLSCFNLKSSFTRNNNSKMSSKVSFSISDDIQLTECVNKHPYMYDLQHSDYND
jgi:hypothetical protein